MSKILIADNISKSFNKNKENVLDKVSISIEKGEFVSIMGPSGSGKSTLMYILSGMDNNHEGETFFNNKNLSSFSEDELSEIRRTKMGFIFQQASLLKNLTILDNIMLTSIRNNNKNIKSIREKALSLMEKVGLKGLENRNISQVSGGQLQRAGICRALMNNPEIIFGDEPTGALNSASAEDIMNILREINNDGTTIILVTHDAKIAAKSEHVIFMSDGKIAGNLNLGKFIGYDIDKRINKVNQKMQKIEI